MNSSSLEDRPIAGSKKNFDELLAEQLGRDQIPVRIIHSYSYFHIQPVVLDNGLLKQFYMKWSKVGPKKTQGLIDLGSNGYGA